MAIAGKVGAVFIKTQAAPVVFNQIATAANAQRTQYSVVDEAYRYFDRNTQTLVYINGVPVASGWRVQHIGGVIHFNAPLEPDDVVTVTGASVEVRQAGGFFNWNAELSADTVETTTFESSGWKESIPAINGFTASAECYWADGALSQQLGQEVIIALYIDSGPNKKRYEGYGVISSESIETSIDDVVQESIEFEGTESLYYRED